MVSEGINDIFYQVTIVKLTYCFGKRLTITYIYVILTIT